jgi:hypothetical protein
MPQSPSTPAPGSTSWASGGMGNVELLVPFFTPRALLVVASGMSIPADTAAAVATAAKPMAMPICVVADDAAMAVTAFATTPVEAPAAVPAADTPAADELAADCAAAVAICPVVFCIALNR